MGRTKGREIVMVQIDWRKGWGEKGRFGEERASRSTVLEG